MNSSQLLQLVESNHILYLARGGGGGSSSRSSSSSSRSSSSSSYRSSNSGGSGGAMPWWFSLLFVGLMVGIPILAIVLILRASKKSGASTSSFQPPRGFVDPVKDSKSTTEQKTLANESREVFMEFQKSWSDFDLKAMKQITSDDFYKKMVLELGVLQNYKRQNIMDNVQIAGAYLGPNITQSIQVYFVASASDKLLDIRDGKVIYTDTSTFAELWTFVRIGKKLVLDKIDQVTTEVSKFDAGIAQFSKDNGFYYDPDFGWLMMPSRGAIFGPAGFGNADINNHVIGYYGKGAKAKIVEFYSYEPKAGAGLSPITVAQAVLPKSYDDILVTEKSWYSFKPKAKGLNKIETESVEFNKKFAVWAANQDQATSFELLATNFMERIYALNFEINIEVVDNVLYLYSPSKNIQYADMLEVLGWAFDEMKM